MAQEELLRLEGAKQHFSVKKERGRRATLYAVDGVDLSLASGETYEGLLESEEPAPAEDAAA